MTIASSSTYEFSIGRIVLHAYRAASLMGIEEQPTGLQWDQRLTYGREVLEMLIKELETEGRLVRARRFYDLTMVSGTEEYTLPESILDVYGDAALTEADQVGQTTSFETIVRQIDQETWNRLGIRGNTGRPTLYWVDRSAAPLKVRLWLTPDDASAGTIRLPAYYLLANSTDANATPDLERYWALYLTDALAERLALAAGLPQQAKMLGDKAAVERQRAKQYSRQRTNNQAVVMHRVGARRSR